MVVYMPELPEVETTRRKISPLLQNRIIERLEHDDPDKYVHTQLAHGQQIRQLARRGKYLILELVDPDLSSDQPHEFELIVHLGMTGGFRLERSKHTRVVIHTNDGVLYFDDIRRFGKIAVVHPGKYDSMPTLANMGPEPLSEDFEEQSFIDLAAHCGMVKSWLLSQRPVSGLGNIYVDESLWLAKIHPSQTRLNTKQAKKLYSAIREVIAKAIQAGGSTLSDGTYQQHDGLSGLFQLEHNVYARQGEDCPRCSTTIEKLFLGQRGTHFCPACQELASAN